MYEETIRPINSIYARAFSRIFKNSMALKVNYINLLQMKNVYGPSPKVKTAIQSHLDELYYYPESGSPKLRKQ